MATGWEQLGEVLGGGVDRAGAFEEGRMHSAKTEGALQLARERQLENIAREAESKAREKFRTSAAESGDPMQMMLADTLESGYGNIQQGTEGLLNLQERDFRTTLGNPEADPMAAFAAGQGVQGKVLNPYDTVGQAGYTDLRAGAPELLTTPLGESLIDENVAQTQLYDEKRTNPEAFRSTVSLAPGGVKPPSGYMANPQFDPTQPPSTENTPVVSIPGGPADPNTPGKIGTRERQIIGRVVNAAANTVSDLKNIMSMPSGASTGFLGSGFGATPDIGLMDATVNHLKNKISPQEVDTYNATLGGLSVQLQTLESMGMRGASTIADQYNALQLRPTDTVQQKMYKMALMRQTVENGLQTVLGTSPLPDDARVHIESLISGVQDSVPFLPSDVLALMQSKNPSATIRDVMDVEQGLAEVPTFSTEAEAEAAGLAPGTHIIINGVSGTWQ
jgi:hypothetical protein